MGVVVAVAFAVGGDVDELGFVALGFEAADEALREAFTAVEQSFKGDGAGAWSVIEEDSDGAPFFEAHEKGARGVDGGVGSFDPNGLGRLRVFLLLLGCLIFLVFR